MSFLEKQKNIQQSYIVCSTGRSGSTLLCRVLKSLKCCGNPEEYFHHKQKIKVLKLKENLDNFLNYCDVVFQEGTTENGVFAIKMHWWQMYDFLKIARRVPILKEKSDVEILNFVFPNLQFIYIWRQDILAQAVSTTIALQTKVWEKQKITESQEKTESKKEKIIQFKPLVIYDWKQKFRDQNRRWRSFLEQNSLEHYEITYETLVENFEEEINNILDFLRIDKNLRSEKIDKVMKKQSNKINKKFIEYYKMFPELLLKVLHKIKTLTK